MDNRIWVKWWTTVEYVDIDTGEIISKAKAIREYNIIFKTKTTKVDGNKGEIKWRNECEISRQTKLF
jgi:hypothetical protein